MSANATTDWLAAPGWLVLLLWPVGLAVVLLGLGGWRDGERPDGQRVIDLGGRR